MEVDVGIQRRTKSLDEGYRPRPAHIPPYYTHLPACAAGVCVADRRLTSPQLRPPNDRVPGSFIDHRMVHAADYAHAILLRPALHDPSSVMAFNN